MTDARLTTIIPWSRRPELERTLRHNRSRLDAMRADIMVVNCGGDGRALQRLLASPGLPRVTQVDVPAPRTRGRSLRRTAPSNVHLVAPRIAAATLRFERNH
jgi:hypothetical protein